MAIFPGLKMATVIAALKAGTVEITVAFRLIDLAIAGIITAIVCYKSGLLRI
ncbi:MAG: hypothetical protein V7765_17110 [Oleispira sp.]